MPTYNPNIPQPNNILSDSQNDILENFLQINTVFAVNHATFETANEGYHEKIFMPQLGAAPVFPANVNGFYSAIPTVAPQTGLNEIFIIGQNGFNPIPITATNFASDGWTFFPSGILVKWGDQAGVTGFNQPILYPNDGNTATPDFGIAPNQVLITIQVASGSRISAFIVQGSSAIAGFNVDVFNTQTGAAATADISYYAIGIPV